MTGRTAIITGVSGQDGWHLSQRLLAEGYRVVGVTRDATYARPVVDASIELAAWDFHDDAAFRELLRRARPTEIYNLAAHSSGAGMFDAPVAIGEINGLAVALMLEAVREVDPAIRFWQASSSELYGAVPAQSPQSETTPFAPRSPYGAAKLYAHTMVGIYRRHYGLFACAGILFNHESPRRDERFVTGKVTEAAARVKLGLTDDLALGALDARRDWGFSGDYMHAASLMLQADKPDDYVIATGQSHTVRDLCRLAFEHLGLDYRDHVREGQADHRAAEASPLIGDASKAARELGWNPSVTFPQLVKTMVDAHLARLSANGTNS